MANRSDTIFRMEKPRRSVHKVLVDQIRRWLKRREPEHPDDPYALVGAPKKPRTPLRTLAAKARPE
jgi:hypothetical protein